MAGWVRASPGPAQQQGMPQSPSTLLPRPGCVIAATLSVIKEFTCLLREAWVVLKRCDTAESIGRGSAVPKVQYRSVRTRRVAQRGGVLPRARLLLRFLKLLMLPGSTQPHEV